jgi:hypothetical protein
MAKLRLLPASGDPIEIEKDQTLLGRDPGCEVVLSDGSVSRRHARIERRDEVWAVVDLASANGTFLDSQRVADAGLRDGHELRLGAVAFKVEIETAEPDLAATLAGPESDDTAATVIGDSGAPEEAETAEEPLSPPPPPPPGSPELPSAASAPPPPPPPVGPGAALPPHGVSTPGVPPAPSGPAPGGGAKKPLMWVFGGCCGCLILILIVVGLIAAGAFFMTQEPVETARAQLEEIRQGQLDAAYERFGESYRARVSRADFESFVSRHPALKDNQDSTFYQRSVENDEARLSGVLTSNADETESVRFELRKEDGAWVISLLEVDDDDGQRETESRAPGAGSGGGLAVETAELDKQPVSGGTKVKIVARVSGFATRRAGQQREVDLAGDLETFAPNGKRLESLSKQEFHRLSKASRQAIDVATFTTELTLPKGYPDGDYSVRLTFRDLVGGARQAHRVRFALP